MLGVVKGFRISSGFTYDLVVGKGWVGKITDIEYGQSNAFGKGPAIIVVRVLTYG